MGVHDLTRRRVLVAGGLVLLGAGRGAAAAEKKKKEEEEAIPPTEDLMREHGVLRRVLLVYREVVRRVEAHEPLEASWIGGAAGIIRDFIEDYHEKSEEEELFPRLRKAGKLVELVAVLKAQHDAGRKLTASALALADRKDDASRKQLADGLRAFVRMYEPHAAREDTVLFPAYRKLLGERELARVAERFEEREDRLPGGDVEKTLARVEQIEQGLGILDLGAFTPA